MTKITEYGVDEMKEFEHGLKEVFKCGKQVTGTKGQYMNTSLIRTSALYFFPLGLKLLIPQKPSESLKILPS